MAKDKQKPRRQKKGTLWQKARRDTRLMTQPTFDMFDISKGVAESAYGGAHDQIGDLKNPYMSSTNNIMEGLSGHLGDLAGQLGLTFESTPGEGGAAAQYAGDIGAGGLNTLGSQQMRMMDQLKGGQQEAALSERYALDNLAQQINDYGKILPDLTSQRRDELARQAMERQLAKSEMDSNEAFNQLLQDQIGGMLGGGGGGGGGNRPRRQRPGQGGPGSPGNVAGDTQAGGNQLPQWQTRVNQRVQNWQNADDVGDLPPWLYEALVSGNAPTKPRRSFAYNQFMQEPPGWWNPPRPGGGDNWNSQAFADWLKTNEWIPWSR